MQIVFSYAPDTLLQAAWEMLQEPDKKKLNKQAVPCLLYTSRCV